jgi:hypothetical protein
VLSPRRSAAQRTASTIITAPLLPSDFLPPLLLHHSSLVAQATLLPTISNNLKNSHASQEEGRSRRRSRRSRWCTSQSHLLPQSSTNTHQPFKWEGPNDNKVRIFSSPHPAHRTNIPQLLLLTQGRYVKPDEYDQLSQAFPGTSAPPPKKLSNPSSLPSNTHTTGTTVGSIRNHISALRVKQRDAYEDLGWELPEGAAGYSNKKAAGTPKKSTAGTPKKSLAGTPKKSPAGTPKKSTAGTKKRGADESGDDLEETPAKKEKKPLAKKAKKEDVKKASDEEVEEACGVKEDMLEDEV